MEHIEHILVHTIEHSVVDTLYLIPFLYVTYLAMEWLEHKTGGKTQEAIRRAGAGGPFLGALLGAVPQCGFSAAASTLYAGRVITLGTLFAVFLSTSDEMLPIFIAEQVPASTIVKILGAKVVIGMVMGFIVDAALRIARRDRQNLRIHELCQRDGCDCAGDCATCANNPELAYAHHDDLAHHEECATHICGHDHARDGASDGYDRDHAHDGCGRTAASHDCRREDSLRNRDHAHVHACGHDHSRDYGHGSSLESNAHCHEFSCEEESCKGHDHDHTHDHGWKGIALCALKHTVQVTAFIFVVTFALNGTLEVVGEDALATFLGSNAAFSVLASALVGLVPNCAASVAIAQLYVEGVLGAGAMMAGLLVSAGVGLLVLLRANRGARENAGIVVGLYATGVFWGLIINVLGIAF